MPPETTAEHETACSDCGSLLTDESKGNKERLCTACEKSAQNSSSSGSDDSSSSSSSSENSKEQSRKRKKASSKSGKRSKKKSKSTEAEDSSDEELDIHASAKVVSAAKAPSDNDDDEHSFNEELKTTSSDDDENSTKKSRNVSNEKKAEVNDVDDDDVDNSTAHSVSVADIKRNILGRQPAPQESVVYDDHDEEDEEEKKKHSAWDCHICLEVLDTPISLPCGHNFCHSCWDNWYATQSTCPTCRTNYPRDIDYKVNQVLQQCLLQLVPELRRKRKGEAGARSAIQTLQSVYEDRGKRLFDRYRVRRSITTDGDDICMRYALAWIGSQLCLLHIEEDEVDDELPVTIRNDGTDDNEQLVKVTMDNTIVTVTEVESKTILQQCAVRLIEWDKIVELRQRPDSVIRFVHEETTACMEVELWNANDVSARRDSTMQYSDEDELEMEEEDEDDDGFVIKDDECFICKDGGELLICDGKCGKSFHLGCLGREEAPSAEYWICQECAADKGMTVTEGGYEYDTSDNEDGENNDMEGHFSSDEEATLERGREASYGELFDEEDDDGHRHRGSTKRQRLVDSDDDE